MRKRIVITENKKEWNKIDIPTPTPTP